MGGRGPYQKWIDRGQSILLSDSKRTIFDWIRRLEAKMVGRMRPKGSLLRSYRYPGLQENYILSGQAVSFLWQPSHGAQ